MSKTPASTRPRILIISDHGAVRELLHVALTREGYEVVCISDLGKMAGLTDVRFELVVTNTRPPYLSDRDVFREIHEAFPGVSVLHLDDLTRPITSVLPGHVTMLQVPFSIPGLLAAVDRLLQSGSDEPGRTA